MIFDILTLFPSMFDSVFSDSIIKRAVEKKLIEINIDNIRDFSDDTHKHVDDYSYGGGPGMIFKPEPLAKAISTVRERASEQSAKVIFFTPQGEMLKHSILDEMCKEDRLILLCGRYKGIDQRIRDKYVDREISIGDYVLSGGEIPAMVFLDSIARLIPGVLGNKESAKIDSFFNGLLSPSQYTRPEIFEGMRVPEVLISGHHENIRKWQEKQAEYITEKNRPDLWQKYKKI